MPDAGPPAPPAGVPQREDGSFCARPLRLLLHLAQIGRIFFESGSS